MTKCICDTTAVEFVEGTLPIRHAERVEKHIGDCHACRLRVVALGTSPSRLAAAPTPPVNPTEVPTLLPGHRVGRFTVLRELGRGGMGVVLAAHDPDLDRKVALKIMKAGGGLAANDERSTLMREARAMARLDHPNIVTVYEVGSLQHETYIAMELVRGVTLGDWLRRGESRSWPAIVDVFRQAGLALMHAHEHGVAHGDFKPDNVLVDARNQVRVTDFGLSRRIDPLSETCAQLTGEARLLAGTPRYMAPEQFTGQPSDARTDQFSFCVALHEALYREHPFAHDTPLSLYRLVPALAVKPVPARAVPAWLREAVSKGLAADPVARHASMADLVAALTPPAPRMQARPLLATAAMVLMCVGGYGAGSWQIDMPRRGMVAEAGPDAGLPDRDPGGSPGPRIAETGQDPSVPAQDVEVLEPAAAANELLGHAHQLFAPGQASNLARSLHRMVIEELHRPQRLLGSSRAPSKSEGTAVASAMGPGVASQPAAPPYAGSGLPTRALRDSIHSRWRDLEVCFREWRERQPHGEATLAVQLRIESDGRATVMQQRGITDRVVKQCVAGALEAARYPTGSRATLASVAFGSAEERVHLRHLSSRGGPVRVVQ